MWDPSDTGRGPAYYTTALTNSLILSPKRSGSSPPWGMPSLASTCLLAPQPEDIDWPWFQAIMMSPSPPGCGWLRVIGQPCEELGSSHDWQPTDCSFPLQVHACTHNKSPRELVTLQSLRSPLVIKHSFPVGMVHLK